MEFKLCHIGNELYGDASILENEFAKTDEKKVLRYNKKQGTQYTFKNKQIENVLYNDAQQQNDSVRCDFQVMSKSRKVTFRIQH